MFNRHSCRRNRRYGIARSWSSVPAQVDSVEPRILLSATAIEHDGIGYFLSESNAQVLRYDVTAESWLTPVDLSSGVERPSTLHADADGLYVGFGRSVYRYGLDGSNKTHLLNTSRNVLSLHSDGNLLFAHSGGGGVGGAVSVNKATNTVIDMITGTTGEGGSFFYNSRGTSISESANRIFGRSVGISPSDIIYLSYEDSGTFIENDGSPYHARYPNATQTWVFPDGQRVVDDSGSVYSTDSLTYLTQFAAPKFDDITFIGNNVPVVLSSSETPQLTVYTSGLQPVGMATLEHEGQEVFVNDSHAIVFRMESGQWLTEIVPLSDLNVPASGEPVDPVGLAYTPDQVEVASDGTLLIFSAAHQSIFQWDMQQQIYLDTIPLIGSPQRIAYSASANVVYLAYTDGLIRKLDLSSPDPAEVPFVTLSYGPSGLSVAGNYVFATSDVFQSIDSEGNVVDSASFNSYSSEFVWSEANQKFYFESGYGSPVLRSFELNENGTTYENELPGGIGRMYHASSSGSSGNKNSVHVSPDGSQVLLSSGIFYNPETLNLLNTGLANSIDDAAWLGSTLLTLRDTADGAEFQQWDGASYQLIKTLATDEVASMLVPVSTEHVVGITVANGIPNFTKMDAELNTVPQPARNLIVHSTSSQVFESAGSGAVQITVERSGSTTLPLHVQLVSDTTSELTVPAEIIIPAGQTSFQVPATAVDDFRVDGNQSVQIFATARQYSAGSVAIDVLDNEFIVSESDNETSVNEDGATDTILVSLPNAPTSTVTIQVNSDSQTSASPEVLQFTIDNWNQPQKVTISGTDDDVLDGTETAEVNLSVAEQSDEHFVTSAAVHLAVTIYDDEIPVPEITAPVGQRLRTENVVLTWGAIPTAERYEIWLTRLGDDGQPITDSTLNTTYQLNGLDIGFYNVWVRALLPGNRWSSWGSSRFSVDLPIQIAPLSTERGHNLPTLSWTEVAGATEYEVWANNITTGATGLIRNQVSSVSFDFPELGFGQYSIWVRAIGPRNFAGTWSETTRHYVGPAMDTAPRATLSERPTFTWDTMAGIDQFRIWISGPQGFRIDESGIEETSFVPEENLPAGTYHWWVLPQTESGRRGQWSSRGTVHVGGGVLGISIEGESWDSSPILRWQPTEGAASYEVYLRDVSNTDTPVVVKDIQATQLQLTVLLDSSYQTWVRPIDAEGNAGRWSQRFDYELHTATANLPIAAEKRFFSTFDRHSATAVLSWNTHSNAATYDIIISNPDDDESRVFEFEGITTNSFAPVDLAAGTWVWSVRGRTANGEAGAWSEAALFDTQGLALLLMPENAFTTNPEPRLNWTSVEGATRYALLIIDAETQQEVFRNERLTETSYTLAEKLGNGTYRLWIKALSVNSTLPGIWSPGVVMTIASSGT